MAKTSSTSIARRLTRMNLLVSATALLLACAGFTAYDFISFRLNVVRTLSTQVQSVASNGAAGLVAADAGRAGRALASFRMSRNVLAASIYDANGHPLATYLRDKAQQFPVRPEIPSGQGE